MSDTVVQVDGRPKAYRPLPDATRAVAVREGLEAYDRGDFFEAHEAWEPAWMGTDDVTERALVQGLIKVAAADVHGVRGNPKGVARNLEGALERLVAAHGAGRSTLPGATVDVGTLVRDVEARLALAGAGRRTDPIAIAWRPA